jgi:hypothetical protein
MEQNSNGVTLRLPELRIPAGYIFKGDVLLGEIEVPQQDIIFKDVQIDATELVDEVVRRVVAEVTAITLGIPSLIEEERSKKEKAAIETYFKRRVK